MIKIINWLITKSEKRLSKKENAYLKKETSNKKLKLYRNLLNEIDEYICEVENVTILRHYRYITFNVDDLENKGE